VTAIFAATIGLAQTDIKKVLAYSTVSQLGYMFLAAGCGAYGVAVFHLGTHAFFKALLFLGSGSVIHAMGGEQDIRKMGGLRKALPVTYWTFLVGTLAISGVPGLAGFFSKDAILAASWGQSKLLWLVGLVTAGLTACYMFRLVFLTFGGEFRGTEEQRHHLHESPRSMTVPLTVLAVGSVLAGYVGLPRLGEWNWNWLETFLAPVWVPIHQSGGAEALSHAVEHHPTLATELALMGLSVGVAGLGIWIAWSIWGEGGIEAGEKWAKRSPAIHRLLFNKYWVDEFYDAAVVRPLAAIARFCRTAVDGILIEGGVHSLPFFARLAGDLGRFSTTGNVRNYALYFFAGVVLLLWWLLG
jgi:NADH-quinone oxidoreductase subunit L